MSRLQELPVMDRLFVGSYINRSGVDPKTWSPVMSPYRVDKQLFEYFVEFKRVKLSDNERRNSTSRVWDIRREFGHLMLPYPKVWIEWNNLRGIEKGEPQIWQAAMCVHRSELESFWEIWFEDNEAPKVEHNGWIAVPLWLVAGVVTTLPYLLIVDLDETGVLSGVRAADITNAFGRPPGAEETFVETVDLLWDALVAVGWMNCRNVEVKKHDRSLNGAGSVRKRRRNRAKGLDFHTIKLPGIRYDSEGFATEEGDTSLRLHHVRGHFKTFTSEAPLLGMHTGTYWWGWQVRGNKKNGVVVSDYKVGAQ